MTSTRTRTIGENAAQKQIRLLARLNERFADPDVTGMKMIKITQLPTGASIVESPEHVIFCAESQEDLMHFLEAPVAEQIQLIVTNM